MMTKEDSLRADIRELDSIIDEIRDIAFDKDMDCKEKIKEIKINLA